MLIVDAHQDLAWNMLSFGRDYTKSAAETRRLEAGTEIPKLNGDTLLGWPDYQRGQVALVFATLFAAPIRRRLGKWETLVYEDKNQAHQLYNKSLDQYHRLADGHPDKFSLIRTQAELRQADASNQNSDDILDEESGAPVGLIVLMEGAEGVREPAEVEEWWARGVRLIGPAWAGTRFCGGTDDPGPLTSEGFALLEAMAAWNIGLDISHMDEIAALQALDFYPNQIVATHGNALALLKGSNSNRHLSDRVIRGVLEREGAIGVVAYNSFLLAGWQSREQVNLGHVVAQIDYICQMAGDPFHVGIGSDFDGGLGLQSTPIGIDTVADLQKLVPLLADKGYSQSDIAAIMGNNWIDRLRNILPE